MERPLHLVKVLPARRGDGRADGHLVAVGHVAQPHHLHGTVVGVSSTT